MEIRADQKVAVLGAGVEGRAVIEFLTHLGCTNITVCDKNEKIKLPASVDKRLGDEYLAGLDEFDLVFRSPGIPRDLAGILDAEESGTVITSLTKEFVDRCPCTMIGITGTNGKTTTTELASRMLAKIFSSRLWVGGNDRAPLLSALDQMARDDVVLLELSSFQLEDLHRSPNISVILNLSPNHLDQHADLEAYYAAKTNILIHQRAGDFAILNYSFLRLRELSEKTQATVLYFNTDLFDSCAFVREGKYILRWRGDEQAFGRLDQGLVRLNSDNVLASALVGAIFGLDAASCGSVVKGFEGVEHRIEFVRDLDRVRWYNDSASTTPESTINALLTFPQGKVILLSGGSDKGLGFESLAEEILRTGTRAVLYGATAARIRATVKKAEKRYKNPGQCTQVDTLEQAVKEARTMAREHDIVVLSPGCASFDQFKNSKERGKRFKRLVRELKPAH